MKIKDEKGNEIEVFTASEVADREKVAAESAATKALEEYKTANPDKSGELTKLQDDLKAAKQALEDAEKGGDKDGQVQRLRKERDEALNKVNEVVTTFKKELDEFKSSGAKEVKDTLLTRFAGADADLKKKIEFEFDNYRPTAVTKKDVEERMEKAYQLATGNKPKPGTMDIIVGGAGERGGANYNSQSPTEVTPNARAIGNVLGVSDADRAMVDKARKEGKLR